MASNRPQEVTRHIKDTTTALLWGRAAGRCQFAGCNDPLWKSPVTQEKVNRAQRAHIYSFSAGGPRGNGAISARRLNAVENLMLVCHSCHQKIDAQKDGGRYGAPLLLAWKAEHERRIEIVTAVASNKKSHVVLFGANVGNHSSPLRFNEAAMAMFPHRYPAEDVPIELSTINSSFLDRDSAFWTTEAMNLQRKFQQRVREGIATRDIGHLSVFALAPQPLLVLLGTLLGDIAQVDVFQRHREPASWEWPVAASTPAFRVREPDRKTGPPVLILALSGTVVTERVTSLVGPNARIWTITVAKPHNDTIKSRAQLSRLRALIRRLLDQIKATSGQTATLHVFPVAPVSAAVELGRVRMPKADMPWLMYDQVNARGGFVPTLLISDGASQ